MHTKGYRGCQLTDKTTKKKDDTIIVVVVVMVVAFINLILCNQKLKEPILFQY